MDQRKGENQSIIKKAEQVEITAVDLQGKSAIRVAPDGKEILRI